VARLRGVLRASGCGYGGHLGAHLSVQADWLQPEGVLSLWNHRQWDGRSIRFCVHVPGFQPRAEPGIEDLRLALPEIGLQTALNLEMIQLQFDARNVFWEIAPDIVRADMKSGDSTPLALCLDHHTYLPINAG
jgi:hypothetical protein